MSTPTTVARALAAAGPALDAAGVDNPMADARRMMAHALGIAPGRLTLHLGDPLTPAQAAIWRTAIAARARRQPVSQIIGHRAFWGRQFRVTRDTLDPRPETETLIEVALQGTFARVLDLGTGTGCLLLTCLAERPSATGIGTDLSVAALAVARENCAALGLTDRAELRQADWWDGVAGRFDLILSNPPYIPASELAALQPEVRDWEPHLALSPGTDGLAPYRHLAAGVAQHLAPGGRILVEVGPGQAAPVAGYFVDAGLAAITIHADLEGRDRVVGAQLA